MSRYVGLDWGGTGWVAVVADDGGDRPFSAAFYPSILNAWRANRDAETILVDIPIGLAEADRRQCDEDAKSILGDGRSRVFYTPVREAVYEDRFEAAGDANETATGNRISTQAYHICPAIREVDGFLREFDAARGVVREAHPEVCFAALAGKAGLPSKATDDGVERRREILEAATNATVDLETFLERAIDDRPVYARRFRTSHRDDLLDAFALAVTARGETTTLPADPPTDDCELPMEIVAPAAASELR